MPRESIADHDEISASVTLLRFVDGLARDGHLTSHAREVFFRLFMPEIRGGIDTPLNGHLTGVNTHERSGCRDDRTPLTESDKDKIHTARKNGMSFKDIAEQYRRSPYHMKRIYWDRERNAATSNRKLR